MIDGVRREFPQAFAAASRIPNPRFARASPMWAVLAAFGAGFFVSAVVTIIFSLVFRSTTRDTPLPAAFALAVAWTVGGRRAVVGYVGIVLLEMLLGLPSQVSFCSTSGADPNFAAAGLCSVGTYLVRLWPQLLGAALAFALVRWVRAGAGDRNPTLEAAGAFVIVQGVGGSSLNAGLGPSTAGSPEWPLLFLLVAIVAGTAMGYTILRRTSRHWRTLGLVALVMAGEFGILSLPIFVSQILLARGTNLIGPFDLLAYFSTFFALAAAALVLYIAAARKVTATQGA
jgi:hypothetical protein